MSNNREYEIVIQSKNILMDELRGRIKNIGGEIYQPEQIFYHIKYSHPYKNKRNHNNFIRLRNEGNKITLTYKIYDTKHGKKYPIEHEVIVNDFKEANIILNLLGCKKKYECHKLREIWKLEDCEIVFDTYPGIETYAELECDSEDKIKQVLKKLYLDTNLNLYNRLQSQQYYKKIYGIQQQQQQQQQYNRLSFKTAYKILLERATINKSLLKSRLDDVNKKYKEQILELEKLSTN